MLSNSSYLSAQGTLMGPVLAAINHLLAHTDYLERVNGIQPEDSTLLPFALAVGAVRVISAATAGIAATSEPLFAVAFAWLLLGQTLNPAQLAGAALVVAGVVLAQLAAARAGARGPRDQAPGSIGSGS